jgi:hypothetical protein
MRIVELLEHPVDRFPVQFRRAHRVHVVPLDVRHYLVEQAWARDGRATVEPAFDQPPAGDQRGTQDSQYDERARAHATPED